MYYNNVCKCCGSNKPQINGLCNKCKSALDLIGNSIEEVMKLVKYLKQSQHQRPNKLNLEKAQEIRQKYFQDNLTQQELAVIYHVTQAAIGRVVNNITYKENKFAFGGESDFIVNYNYIPL